MLLRELTPADIPQLVALNNRNVPAVSPSNADGMAALLSLTDANPGSLRFHDRLGFAEVGRQATKGDTITVAMLVAPVV